MRKSALVLVVVTLWAAGDCFGQPDLIRPQVAPEKPTYQEASYDPRQQVQPVAELGAVPPPAPRDQLYVFWFLGKMISYPVDKVEGYVTNMLQRRALKKAPEPLTTGDAANPFDSVNMSEIPPAPPAVGGVASSKR